MNRFQRRRELLKSQGRCVQCTASLPPNCPTLLCLECQEEKNALTRTSRCTGAKAAKSKRFEEHITAVIASAHNRTAKQQAEDLGVTVVRICGLRAIARRRGFEVPVERGGNQGGSGGPSGKWDALESEMRTVCQVCGLRGFHECLEGDAQARSGAGRVFPSYGWL